MLRKFKDIKNAPKATKEQYAFLYAAVITSVIAGVWLVSVPERFGNIAVNGELLPEVVEEPGNFARVFSDMKNQFASTFDSLQTDEGAAEPAVRPDSAIEAGAPADASNRIDIDAMFTATSSATTTAPQQKSAPRTVLIATTTASSAASQNE